MEFIKSPLGQVLPLEELAFLDMQGLKLQMWASETPQRGPCEKMGSKTTYISTSCFPDLRISHIGARAPHHDHLFN